jgi:molybdate transport system ATP-binding protein
MLQVSLHQSFPITLDASLRCAPGELVAVVGPSGSGKSTLLKTIAGLLRGATGRVTVGDSTWFDSGARVNVPAHLRRVGFVFQSHALFPHMTVLENVMAAAQGSGEQRRADARAALASVNIAGFESRRPSQLSGGQQQRVGLARALVRRPQALLLDEPFSAVDQMTRERLYEELSELRAELRIPTVLVTHSIPEAQLLADAMVVLHRGRTLQSGPPESVYRRPADPDVARLMGHKNVLPARVLGVEHETVVIDWKGIRLQAAGRAEPGPVTLCIVADDVRLFDGDTAGRGNVVEARVERMVPIGTSVTVHSRVGNGEPMVLSAQKQVLTRRAVAVGSSVRLSVMPHAIHLMGPERTV